MQERGQPWIQSLESLIDNEEVAPLDVRLADGNTLEFQDLKRLDQVIL